MNPKFMHDLCNVLAIVQGKVRQANKLAQAIENKESVDLLQIKLSSTLKELERMELLIISEKEALQKKGV